jgi:hypothetical protein
MQLTEHHERGGLLWIEDKRMFGRLPCLFSAAKIPQDLCVDAVRTRVFGPLVKDSLDCQESKIFLPETKERPRPPNAGV